MSKLDKGIYKDIWRKITEYEDWEDYQLGMVLAIRAKVSRLANVAEHYRTRIGRLKRQVQQLNKEIKLLKEVI